MVELIENSLILVAEELELWQSIIGENYTDYELLERRNILANKARAVAIVRKRLINFKRLNR
jgi:hypothetical protein